MKILVACEFSGIVTAAFRKLGHDAVSCDLIDTEGNPNTHFKMDVKDMLCSFWDLMIAFPPCTHLASSGARWFSDKVQEQKDAVEFVKLLWNAPIERIAIENPIGVLSSKFRKPDQIIQPWMFGHGETKATCLWLKNLPKLQSTHIVDGREGRVWKEPPGPDRWKNRSRTYTGIAQAMAEQWGSLT
jgi:hypothetical protein